MMEHDGMLSAGTRKSLSQLSTWPNAEPVGIIIRVATTKQSTYPAMPALPSWQLRAGFPDVPSYILIFPSCQAIPADP